MLAVAQVFRDQVHVFHAFERASPEAEKAINSAGAFVRAIEPSCANQPDELDAMMTGSEQ